MKKFVYQNDKRILVEYCDENGESAMIGEGVLNFWKVCEDSKRRTLGYYNL